MNHPKKPEWLKARLPSRDTYFQVARILESRGLNTICQSARCPNIGECWERRTATFLILGNVCTRNCGFCAVPKGKPLPPDEHEPEAVVEAIRQMGLRYAVITSVTRDDLPDGGAGHFARTIRLIKENIPGTLVEVLIPDFGGSEEALLQVLEAGPDVLNHNLETTLEIYPRINRPGAHYFRSLELLRKAASYAAITKSGLMLGLGETPESLKKTIQDLRETGCRLLTLGQYLQAGRDRVPVERYYSPEEFSTWRDYALSLGFDEVVAGPLVRSSYQAENLYSSSHPFKGQT